jgi:hypothetical protein
MEHHMNIASRPRIALALSLTVLFAGCLTIEENYTFKPDGSGTMEYVVDMSEMAEPMKGLSSMTEGTSSDKNELQLGNYAVALKELPGIKRVKVKKEKEGSVQRLTFKFADLNALNAALNTIMPDSTGTRADFFHWEGNTLVRVNNRHAREVGNDMGENNNEDGSDSTMATQILESMKYKYSFTFKRPISEVQQAAGVNKEQPSPKQVKLDTDWGVIMRDPKALDLRITVVR